MSGIAWLAPLLSAWRSGRQVALLFDYDGTLVPLAPHPDLARPGDDQRNLLRALAGAPGVSLGVVSGRALVDLKECVRVPGIYYGGCSGGELDLDGNLVRDPVLRVFTPIRDTLQAQFLQVVRRYPGAWLEVKPLGLSVHYRAVALEQVPAFLAECRVVLATVPVSVREVALAVEVTAANGWDKGHAVAQILAHRGQDTFPLFAGDSANDGPACATVAGRGGITIGVGPEAPPTLVRLADPAELYVALTWLVGELTSSP